MIVDEALELLGKRNIYILLWYIIVSFLKSSTSCFAILAFLWANAKPKSFHCKVPDGMLINETLPFENKNGRRVLSQCLQYSNFSPSSNKTVPCQLGYVYESYMDTSVVMEWNLVCDQEYLGALADSSFFILSVLASSIFTALADRFGRRPVFVTCLLSMSIIGFLTTFSPNVYVYIILRLLIGPLQQGAYTVGFCYCAELFPMKGRSLPSLMSEMFWAVGSFILCLIAYLVRDWRVYYYVTTLPFLLAVVLFWCMPESIPWLVARGRLEEANKTLKKAAKFSRNDIASLGQLELTAEENKETKGSDTPENMYPCYFICIRKPVRKWTVINICTWLTTGLSYYGIQIFGASFGNVYFNFFLISLIEVPAIFLAALLGRHYSRRLMVSTGHWCTALMVTFLFLGMTFAPSLTGLNVVFVVAGRFFISLVFTLIFLHTSEMYPTSLRTMGVAAGTSSARLGIAVAPFLKMLSSVAFWLPSILIAAGCFISGFMALWLPDTRRWPLPQSLGEVSAFRKDPKYKEKYCHCIKSDGNC